MKKNYTKGVISTLLVILCLAANGTNANANTSNTTVYDVKASALNVRSSPSTGGRIIAKLSQGRDVLNQSDLVHESGSSRRIWKNCAYPDSANGKYISSTKGWMCSAEGNSNYLSSATTSAILSTSGAYLYYNSSLTDKENFYSKGQTFGPGNNTYIKHTSNNLNAWIVKPGGNTRYMDGWKSDAR